MHLMFVHSFCTAFRETFRRKDGESTDKEVMDRHIGFYHIGRALLECGEYFGTILEQNAKVFHGLNRKMYFKSFVEYFNAPISTTQSKIIGVFCDCLSICDYFA